MDTRFSSAIHALTLVSKAETPVTSEKIAESVGTNASYIRKLLGTLKDRGIISSCRGRSGFQLNVPPEELSLLEIYQAVSGNERVRLFDLHRNPSDRCIVGRNIVPVLTSMFREVDEQAEAKLKEQTLADCIRQLKKEIRA